MTAPVFLFTGPESGELNDAIEKYKSSAEKKFGDIDYHQLYATDTSVYDLISLLQNGSLFSSMRFVIFRNAELIKKKDEISLLENWIKEVSTTGSQDAWLFLVSDEISVDKKLEKLIPKENKKIFWEMFEDRKEQWLRDFFIKNGYRIEENAISTILELIENNTEALKTECSRFFVCFDKGHIITEDDVDNILAHNREESPFTLFDAISDRQLSSQERFETSLEILQKILQSKNSNGVQLIAGLTWCFRKLKLFEELHQDNYPDDFELKKNGFSSKKIQNQYKNGASLYNYNDVNKILTRLAETDISLRSSGSGLEKNLLEMLIYIIVIKKGTPTEKMEEQPL